MLNKIWGIILRLFMLIFSLMFVFGIWTITGVFIDAYLAGQTINSPAEIFLFAGFFISIISIVLASMCYRSNFSEFFAWIFALFLVPSVVLVNNIIYASYYDVIMYLIFLLINSVTTLTLAGMFYLSHLSEEIDKLKLEIVYVRTKWPVLMLKLSDLASEGDTSAFTDLHIKAELKLLSLWHEVFNVKKLFILGSGTVSRKEKYLRQLDQERQWLKLAKETLSQTLEEACESSDTLRSVYQSRRQEDAIEEAFTKAQAKVTESGQLLD